MRPCSSRQLSECLAERPGTCPLGRYRTSHNARSRLVQRQDETYPSSLSDHPMNQTRRHLLDRAVLLLREVSTIGASHAARATDPALLQNGVVYVLSRLVASGDVRPRDLLPSVHLTSGGLSNLLGRLEQAGLITREAAEEDDLRAVVVSITPEGREFEQRMASACTEAVGSADSLVKELIVVLVEAGAVPTPTELPTAPTTETSVSLGLVELTMATIEAISLGDDGEPADPNAALTLAALDHLGPLRPRFLSDLLKLTSGGTSRLLDRLEHAGLVERDRERLDSDHRGVVVTITPAGVAHLEALLHSVAAHLDDLLGLLRAIWVQVHGSDAD